MQDLGIVTPEAVRLEFETAGPGSRVLSVCLDLVIQLTILFGATFVAAAFGPAFGASLPEWVPIVLVTLLSFAVIWGYPVGCETLTRGKTPGKAALGLRVVTREGAPIRFRHAAIRATLALVDYPVSAGAVAVVSMLVTQRNQRLGDLVAGTVVLRERTVGGSTAPVRFTVPAGAEGYAETLDTGGLTASEYQQIRAYLLRAPSLRPEARARLSQELAARTASVLAHRPPSWVTPETFLVIVAARYQQRPGAGPVAAEQPAAAPSAWPPPASWPAPGGWSPPGVEPRPTQHAGNGSASASPAGGAAEVGASQWARPGSPVPPPPAGPETAEPGAPDRGFAPPA